MNAANHLLVGVNLHRLTPDHALFLEDKLSHIAQLRLGLSREGLRGAILIDVGSRVLQELVCVCIFTFQCGCKLRSCDGVGTPRQVGYLLTVSQTLHFAGDA